MGERTGSLDKSPVVCKKGAPPFQHVNLLDFDFQYGHVGVGLMFFSTVRNFSRRIDEGVWRIFFS